MATDSAKLAFLRDAYLSVEQQEAFYENLKDPAELKEFCILLSQDMHGVYKKVMDLIQRVENGEYTEEQMEIVSKTIAFYVMAQDNLQKTLSKNMTKSSSNDNEKSC